MKNRKFWVSLIAGILAAVLLLSLLVGILPTKANAASSSEIRKQINELEAQQEEIEAQIADLEEQISENISEMQEIVDQKKVIDQEVFLLHEQIDNINEQISAYRVLIADKQDELDAATNQYEELSDRYRERVRAMEEEGTLSYWAVIFKANSFSDLLDRLNMIEEIAASDRRRLEELNEAAEKVAAAQAELEEGKADLEQTKATLDVSQQVLEEKRAEADELLAELVAKGEEYEILMAESEEEQSRIMQEIAEKEDEYDAAAYLEYMATYVAPTSGSSNAPAPIPSSTGWTQPLSYIHVSSPFGMRIHPIYGDWRMHYGVDLTGATGTPIYAARGGQVSTASYNSSCGYYVSINHGDGFRSIYMHMTHYIVSAGQYVAAGQVIGYVGSTGDSTGPHLHFGISYNGTYVNPMDYI